MSYTNRIARRRLLQKQFWLSYTRKAYVEYDCMKFLVIIYEIPRYQISSLKVLRYHIPRKYADALDFVILYQIGIIIVLLYYNSCEYFSLHQISIVMIEWNFFCFTPNKYSNDWVRILLLYTNEVFWWLSGQFFCFTPTKYCDDWD